MTRVEIGAKIILTFVDDFENDDQLTQALLETEICLNERNINLHDENLNPKVYLRFHFTEIPKTLSYKKQG